jgi:hypothetical protein
VQILDSKFKAFDPAGFRDRYEEALGAPQGQAGRHAAATQHCGGEEVRGAAPTGAGPQEGVSLIQVQAPLVQSKLHFAAKARISRFTDRNSHFLQVGSRLCRRTIPVYVPTGILSETPVPQRQSDHAANAITGKKMKFPIFPSNDGNHGAKSEGRPCRSVRLGLSRFGDLLPAFWTAASPIAV